MLRITLLLIVLSTLLSTAFCQRAERPDSLAVVARADAKNFRMDDAVWKKYKHTLPFTSDYFKPGGTGVKKTALLSDSVYVDAYRHEAFKRNKHRHTAWHYLLVGGSIAAGVVLLALTAIIIFIAPTMG